jgi:protein TonB
MLALAAGRRAPRAIVLAVALSAVLHVALALCFVAPRSRTVPQADPTPIPVTLLREPAPGPPATAPPALPPATPARVAPPPVSPPRRAQAPPRHASAKAAVASVAPKPAAAVGAPDASPESESAAASPPLSAPAPSGGGGTAESGPDAVARYVASVLRAIDAEKRYPRLAKARGVEGTVVVTLWISEAGSLDRIEIGGAAPPLLAASTREAVERASPFPPPPSGMPSIRVPVRYALR